MSSSLLHVTIKFHNDKGLYATMIGGRIDPLTVLISDITHFLPDYLLSSKKILYLCAENES